MKNVITQGVMRKLCVTRTNILHDAVPRHTRNSIVPPLDFLFVTQLQFGIVVWTKFWIYLYVE